jgi:rare lipoprotein A (peptidoglycan hydrolase)
VRRFKVVAGVALIATLASVAVPGVVGSQPLTPSPVDAMLFRNVDPASVSGTAMTPATLDPAGAAAGRLDDSSEVNEPGQRPVETGRPNGAKIQPRPRTVVVLKPKPKPRVTVTSGGSWRRDPEVSWYGPGFYGNRTACGLAMTTSLIGVAHRSLPCGTKVTFRNPANGRTITVPVVDRGPYVAGRQWDMTGGLCVALDHCYTGPMLYRLP